MSEDSVFPLVSSNPTRTQINTSLIEFVSKDGGKLHASTNLLLAISNLTGCEIQLNELFGSRQWVSWFYYYVRVYDVLILIKANWPPC